MVGLNYNHLFYFYRVVVDGGVTAAAKSLHLTPQTISGQISALEGQIGYKLFERQGKQLKLTYQGKIAFSYVEEIFQLGEELKSVLKAPDKTQRLSLSVGIVDVIPKILSFSLIKPATMVRNDIKLTCREGELEFLLTELANNRLDLVLSDRPLPPGSNHRGRHHVLIESGVGLYASKELSVHLQKGFPQSLQSAPVLMPARDTMLSQLLINWFDQQGVEPTVVGEFDDSALAKAFAQESLGILAAPCEIEDDLQKYHHLSPIGLLDGVCLRFYAILPYQKVKVVHPAVQAILEQVSARSSDSADTKSADR